MRAPFTNDRKELLTRAEEIFAALRIKEERDLWKEKRDLWLALADIFEDLGEMEASAHARLHYGTNFVPWNCECYRTIQRLKEELNARTVH